MPCLSFLILSLLAWFNSPAVAGQAKPEAAPAKPAEKAAKETNKEGAEPKKEPAEPAAEDVKAKLLAVFQKEESITNTLGMVMVWVPKGYRVSRYEVTQRDFEQVMKANPSKFKGDNRPVESVTWEEAGEFCKKLTDKEQAEGKSRRSCEHGRADREHACNTRHPDLPPPIRT